MFQSKDYR